MKKLYLIGGPMGVGKTSVCQELKLKLPDSVFLDGDWCWDASPFYVTGETKQMVMDNICHLLGNFLSCSAYQNVIFCWVMDHQEIIDDILRGVETKVFQVYKISLLCGEKELCRRLEKDIAQGLRQNDVLARSCARLPLYQSLDTKKIDTSDMTVDEIVEKIAEMTR